MNKPVKIKRKIKSEITTYDRLETQVICPIFTNEFLRGFKFAQMAIRDTAAFYKDDDAAMQYLVPLILNNAATNIESFVVSNDE